MTTPTLEELARRAAQADGLQIGEAPNFAEWHWEDYVEQVRAVVRALEPAIAGVIYDATKEFIVPTQAKPLADLQSARLVAQITGEK